MRVKNIPKLKYINMPSAGGRWEFMCVFAEEFFSSARIRWGCWEFNLKMRWKRCLGRRHFGLRISPLPLRGTPESHDVLTQEFMVRASEVQAAWSAEPLHVPPKLEFWRSLLSCEPPCTAACLSASSYLLEASSCRPCMASAGLGEELKSHYPITTLSWKWPRPHKYA